MYLDGDGGERGDGRGAEQKNKQGGKKKDGREGVILYDNKDSYRYREQRCDHDCEAEECRW